MATDPGPFQKYLFSGACYVQVGECYGQLIATLRAGQSPSSSTELAARLAALWHDQAMRQSAMVALMPGAKQPDRPGMIDNDFVSRVQGALQKTGQDAVNALLTQYGNTDPDSQNGEIPDFATFFEQWVVCCSAAWDEIIRAEWFAEAFGQAVNQWIRSNP